MKTYTIESNGETVEYVEIELSEGNFTSMPKDVYDLQQSQQNGMVKP